MLRTSQFLTILTSKSLSRAGVVQILSMSTAKSVPGMPVFNDFGFQIALARRRCKFCRCQLPKVAPACQFLTILTSKSLSRAGVVQILSTSWTADPSQLPFFGPTFASLRSDKTMEKHSISRNSYPPKHLCCQNIDAGRATGNFQYYSRKLELLNFLWLYLHIHIVDANLKILAQAQQAEIFILVSKGSQLCPQVLCS